MNPSTDSNEARPTPPPNHVLADAVIEACERHRSAVPPRDVDVLRAEVFRLTAAHNAATRTP